MECNKEEAVKAMQLSETKMQNKDYIGAMKMAQKAQRLFPDLENISRLLTVCEVHCTAENKLGGSEMDWYGILQIQQFDNDVTIKKQYRRLALLLHPDKNKFAGSEAAFKLIGEANRVLSDKQKRSIYDIKYRTLARPGGPKTTAHQSNIDFFAATNSRNNPQSSVQPNTFWTQCYYCFSKFQYYRDFLGRLLRCQRCRKAFEAHEFREGVHPESFRNGFPNHKEPPSQGPSNVASQSNGGTKNGNFTRFQNGDAAFKPVSKVGTSADLSGASNAEKKDIWRGVEVGKQGVETSKSGPVKSKDTRTSRNMNKERENSTFEFIESLKTGNRATADTEHAAKEKNDSISERGGRHPRRSPRNKHNLSSLLDDKDDDDFVSPPFKRLRKGQLFSAAEEGNNAVVGGHKKNTREKVGFPLEENLPKKKSKTEEFELKVKGAAMSDNDESNFKADFSPVANVGVASTPGAIEVPDPQFHKFVLDEDSLPSLFEANQIWALYDPADDMPRYYAFVKKVLTPGFKLKIRWLEANPDDQGEIDWCEKELPVACGKFKLGKTQEIKNHLMFSHQMHYTKGSDKKSILVYPRKGETWAIYQNWDIGWSSEPEKHMPYKYEFVEVSSDFVEAVGIGVRYLGKVKGFVSLFLPTEQHGVVMFQVPTHELYRFSHQIPSFKMTGCEGSGVPPGSFELDPASLPTSIFDSSDLGNLEMDNRSKKTETDGTSCERVGSVTACTGMKQEKKLSERETLMSRSPRESDTESVNCMKGKRMTNLNHGNRTQPEESAIPCQADKRNNTQKKHQKNDSDKESFSLRRSPRELSKNSTPSSGAMKCPDSAKDDDRVSFPQSKVNSTSTQYNNRMHSTLKDHHTPSLMKNPVAPPPSSSPACRLSQTEFYDFKGLKSQEKFSLGQIWALYSDGHGMPNTYAQVKRIEVRPNFQVHMAVLEPCSEPENLSGPVSCGTFKLKNCPTEVFPLSSFSHCLNTRNVVGRKVFEIQPKEGEVWALYKNHNPEPTCPNLAKGECEIVEVLGNNGKSTEVGVLVKVEGFKSIFKAPRIQRSKTGIIDVPRAEFHRFSHQIPAFQHSGESDSRLAGCWELDPSSIPGTVVSLD